MPSLNKIKDAVVAAKKIASAKVSKNTAKPSTLSTEYVRDSDSEGESDNSDSSVGIAPVPITLKAKRSPSPLRKASIAPSPSKPSSPAPRAPSPPLSDNESQSESESSSDSEESSTASSSSGQEKGADSEKFKSPTVTASRRKPPPELQSAESRLPYKPPNGFESIPKSSALSSTASKVFSSSGLAGKQIWHITAPPSIPVSMIKEVSLESVAKGEAAFTYKGTDYGFVADVDGGQARKKLLIATADGNGYRSAPMQIAQTLHLQQLVHLPSLPHKQSQSSSSSQVSTTAAAGARRPARQQPKGLEMRFRPFGDHSGKSGKIGSGSSSSESFSEAEEAEPEFRMPRGLEAAKGSVKRKHSEVNGMNGNQVQSPKSTGDGHEARRKKAKHDVNHSRQELPSSMIVESDMDIVSPGNVIKRRMEIQQQEDHSRRRETSQERMKRKSKEKGKEKATDGKAKSTHHGHKHEATGSSQSQSKSIAG